MLPPELAAGDSSIAQLMPQATFGVGLCFAQLFGVVLALGALSILSPLTPALSPRGARGWCLRATAI